MGKNNLSLATIKKTAKEVDKTVTYEIEEGVYQGYTITYTPFFSDTAIENILHQLQEIMAEIEQKELKIEDETMSFHLVNLLMIKEFTHLKSQMPSTFIGEGKKPGLIDCLDNFRKTGLYKIILEKVFDPDEVQKVFDHLTDFLSQTIVAMEIEEEFLRKVEAIKEQNSDAYKHIVEASLAEQ